MVNSTIQSILTMAVFVGGEYTCIPLLKDLREGYYVTIPAKLKSYDKENGYAVVNISLESAKRILGMYKLPSFIFTHLSDNKETESEYWEMANVHAPYDKRNNLYVKKEDTCEWEDESGKRDCYSVIGNKFHYSVSASMFESIREMLKDRLSQIVASEERNGRNVSANDLLNFSIFRVGMAAYLRRKTINNNIINNISQHGSN